MVFMSLSGLAAGHFGETSPGQAQMIALLCALLGLKTSFVPEVLICSNNKENQQGLAMRKAKVKRAGRCYRISKIK